MGCGTRTHHFWGRCCGADPLGAYQGHGGEDFACWPWTHFGRYTVCSVYHLARSERVSVDRSKIGQGSSPVVSDNSRIWNKLWASKAPGEMKITLWWFAHDCLPAVPILEDHGLILTKFF
jgi:hypothetical protein